MLLMNKLEGFRGGTEHGLSGMIARRWYGHGLEVRGFEVGVTGSTR